MTETQITQADRDAYAAALEKMKYARSADAVRNGFEDKHPIVQAFAAHRATRTDATPVAVESVAELQLSAFLAGRGSIHTKVNGKTQESSLGPTMDDYRHMARTALAKATHPPATDVAALVEVIARDYWNMLRQRGGMPPEDTCPPGREDIRGPIAFALAPFGVQP